MDAFSGVRSFSVDTSLHWAELAAYRQLSPKWSKPAWADNSESKRACLLAETPGPLLFAAHWSRHGGTIVLKGPLVEAFYKLFDKL